MGHSIGRKVGGRRGTPRGCCQNLGFLICSMLPLRFEEWLEDEMVRPWFRSQLHADERYGIVLLVLRAVNGLFRELFSAGAWLRQHEANLVGQLGLRALRGIRCLADMSLQKGEPRFPWHSKMHALFHTFHGLKEMASKGLQWVENPLTDSCQLDEGFVGVVSRYSRWVSPKQTIERTYDLYLTSLRARWVLAD